MADLAGRVALILGGSRGIGRGIALGLARRGADCVVTYRADERAGRAAVAEVQALGRRGLALPLDLREPEQVGVVVERVAKEFSRLDVLVASAAATAFRPMLEQKPHNVTKTLAISVQSFVAAVQAAVPLMASGGRIIVISGIDSHQAMTGHGMLGAAKAAMESLVRVLALELGERGITVNGVNPGFIETDSSRLYLQQGLGLDYDAAVERLRRHTPVRRVGRVEDVVPLVEYLASDAASFLTGQTIVIDGGLTIVSPLTRLED
ncbi:MAG: SDR family oxidoreductase [Candidatus Rokubacteria bacterium]|nr:SDR family oxidoreductase [Candidatus Rokubacteria bacterium]MBI3824507.1 SDR family oxidoreductase [Candidatus Rokubacteria bacterium]